MPGWTIKVTKSKLAKPLETDTAKIDEAVSKVTWTADGKGIEPGYFQKFPVSVGQLPEDADQLVFKAAADVLQQGGRALDRAPAGGPAEPENPAPVLELTTAAAEAARRGQSGATGRRRARRRQRRRRRATAARADSSDTTARVLGVVGIVVGPVASLGVLSGRRRTG